MKFYNLGTSKDENPKDNNHPLFLRVKICHEGLGIRTSKTHRCVQTHIFLPLNHESA